SQDASSVPDPNVVTDVDVAFVDPLLTDRTLDLDHPVIEVDHHHAVGDDALASDRDALERGDRALLTEHALGADDQLALVDADLAGVSNPRPAPQADPRIPADLGM